MTNKSPIIGLDWRDENYGPVHAVTAFHTSSDTIDWSDRIRARFRACVKRAGFAFHDGRCAYIATAGEKAAREKALCDELANAGFQIIRGDVRALP